MNVFCFRKKKHYECQFCFFHFDSKKELKIHKKNCLCSEKNFNELFCNKESKLIPPPHR